jgi:6-phospho-beta-glucosidase
MEGLKFVIIGGGSSYTPELIEGLIVRHGALKASEVVLVDIEEGKEKLRIIKELSERMIKKSESDIRITTTLNRREALSGAAYVITQFRVGGLDARSSDEKIPLKYHTVGQETTGPGGFAKALRTIPIILAIARDMEELCPDAWLVNFTNPSGIITEAVKTYSSIRCIGLCNVPINMERELAKQLNIPIENIYCEFIGLNHLSWIKRVYVEGLDKTEELFKEFLSHESIMKNIPAIKGNKEIASVLRLIPSPYLDYYYFEKAMVEEELEALKSGKGTRADKVKEVEKELFKLYADPELTEKPAQLSERGGSLYSEAALSLIDSIQNNRSHVHVLNVANMGAITDLPENAVIETNCLVNKSGAHPIASGKLPEAVRSLVINVKGYEGYTIKAAVSGDRDTAFKALLNHPLVHGADTAQALLEEILEANKKYLPDFFPEERKK